MGGLAPREDGVKERGEKEGYRGEREREESRPWRTREPRETEIERAIQGRREEERTSEKEREDRELAWVPCALVSGYTSYGSKGRYSGKFRVMQQRGLSSFLSLLLSRIVSFSLASFLRLSFARRRPLLLSLSLSRLCPSGLLVSFRFSSLRINLWCARGDLGARPPTRELVNYFAQRDTSFLTLSHFLLLSHSLSFSVS